MAGSPQGRRRPYRKVLPDRSRAARDRANQKLVEYIVKARGAEGHLRAILKNRKPSRWLKTFLTSGQYVTCVETYLEDEQQLDVVVKYLQGLYQEAGGRAPARASGDRIRFILDVLLPEVSVRRGCGVGPAGGWRPGPRGLGLALGWCLPDVGPGSRGRAKRGARPGRSVGRGTGPGCVDAVASAGGERCTRTRFRRRCCCGKGAAVLPHAPAGVRPGSGTHGTPLVVWGLFCFLLSPWWF